LLLTRYLAILFEISSRWSRALPLHAVTYTRFRSLFPLFTATMFLLVVFSCTETTTQKGVTSVWAVDESEKVRQEDLDHWAKSDPRNRVWDGTTIRVFGARNEIVGFQIILEARGVGATGVDVRLDSLAVPGGFVIANEPLTDDPFDFRGKNIERFTESYINVEKRSDWWLASARPLPDDIHIGWLPDALVPFDVRGNFANGSGGAPFAIGAAKNQGVWIDIAIPPETPQGLYRGTALVLEDSNITYRIPVELRVFGFSLPDTTHLRNHFFWGWQTATVRHGVENNTPEYWKLFDTYARVFHRHRLDLIDGMRTLEDFKRHLADYYTGVRYTARYGYEGPGEGVGNQTYSIGTYDQPGDGWRSGFWPDSPQVWQRAADAWEQWFRDHAPAVVRYKYMEDEPPYAHWGDVKKRAMWIRSSEGVGRFLGTQVTTRMGPELFGAITFWMTGGQSGWVDSGGTTGYDLKVARERQAAGDRVGFYNGQRPSYGEPVTLDNFATDARVNPWIAWKYGADQYFLWETAFYAGTTFNAWVAGVSGSIIYTGEDREFPEESRGLRGPITSIRLKNLRRGFQDYEYLWLARMAGEDTRAIVDAVVPAAFNDYNGSTFTNQSDQPLWADKGYVYEDARFTLATALETAASRGLLPERKPTRVKAK